MPSIKQNCRDCSKEFSVTDWEQEFLKKVEMPLPTLCNEERQRKRLAQRNERNLYKRNCDLCKKVIIAVYPENTDFPVYCSDCWWSDNWDPKIYERDFDFNRPFFDQFKELQSKVPRVGVLTRNSENSEYTNCEAYQKNCYLTFAGGYSEDCMYCYFEIYCKDCLDCSFVEKCELCFQCLDLENCYHCMYLRSSVNCNDCFLSVDLIGCKNCFGCVGLRNKEYHIFNVAYSKEEYDNKIKEYVSKINSPEIKNKFEELYKKTPVKFSHQTNCENCKGDYILNSQNCFDCFDVRKGKDSMHIYWGEEFNDCYDSNVLYGGVELVYNSHSICLPGTNVRASNFCWNVSYTDYSDSCHYSKKLFGCVGLKHKENCILNKQYSKEEYEILLTKIIDHMKKTGEWGEFFPFSNFPYNDSLAQHYLPLTKEDAIAKGYKWREEDSKNYQSLPDTVCCSECKKVFKYAVKEIKFYELMNVEKPSKCHECRHKDRMSLRNPRKLWLRNCAKCSQQIETSYSPERPETVYCEACYLASVY